MKLVFAADEMPPIRLGQGVKRIGSAAEADIVLAGEDILPHHCELQVSPQGVVLKIARGATVRVNQRPVEGVLSLRPGDKVAFGGIEASLQAPEPLAERVMPPQTQDDIGATVVRAALPKYALRAQNGRMLGRVFPLQGATLIGRAPECQLRIDESSLSRKHARLIPTNDGVVVEDLGSTNGSFHNNARIQRSVAQPGDEIGFDTLRFRLVDLGREGAVAADAPTQASRKELPRWVWAVALLAVVAAVVLIAIQ